MDQTIELSVKATISVVRYSVGESASRPWGTWEVLATGEGYTLKRIVVNPGQRLSLQYHNHRAEHWTVVQGVAEVEINGVLSPLTAGENVYVPKRAHHRMKNVSDFPMVLIEVQVGEHLDENDIVRLEDDYARV